VWQSLHASLQERNFTVVTVAMDEPEAARAWIELAKPAYPCLIDRNHHVAELYNLVNVPQATWIDEQGRIVRPPENAGSSDAFRRMDRTTMQMSPEQIAERNRTKQTYVAAVHDWVLKGSASEFAYDAASIRARLRLPDDTVAWAHAHFRLAQSLLKRAKREEAAINFAEASRLHPDSWTIWRQAAEKDATGLAASPEFWARVDALGDRPYHRPIEMKGLREGDA
jgi:AhpC/TSA family